ncbi:MAG: outer membrane protein assembly factor BamE [Gammaproteobacteria bacterium]|nr:outer membrane protein assembly factor BamE [Gammaproteobacteria bacterium]
MILKRILIVSLTAQLLAGCGIVYRQDIQQGNYLKEEEIALVEVGMTRSQVRFALGTPMVDDPFNADRWDYIYYLDSQRNKSYAENGLVILFEDDVVKEIIRQK